MWKQILYMKWIYMCMAVVGHGLRDVHLRFVRCTATCSLIMAHKQLSMWYNHNYMVARILAQMLVNHWQPSRSEIVHSNVIHNDKKMSRCSLCAAATHFPWVLWLSCSTYMVNSKCNLWAMVNSARSHQSHPTYTVNARHTQENNPRRSLYIFRQQHTAFLRHAAQSLFCFQQNPICSINLSFPVKIIFTFYIKQALKFNYPPHRIKVQKRLNLMHYHWTFTIQLPNVELNWCCAACSAMLYIFPNTKSCPDVIFTSQCGIYCSICDRNVVSGPWRIFSSQQS
jgi:hypothetical protein